MSKQIILISITTYFLSINALAFKSILDLNSEINFTPSKTDWATFIVSTEMSLKMAEPVLRQAPSGLYIGVGTDRALNGAALSQNVTHFLAIDYDAKIVRFHKINFELLKAKTLTQYRKLRWDADFSAWQEFSKKNKNALKLTKEDYEWWVVHVRDIFAVGNVRFDYINHFKRDVYYENFVKIYKDIAAHEKSTGTPLKALYTADDFTVWEKEGLKLSKEDWQWWHRFIVKPDFFTATYGKSWLDAPTVAFDLPSFKDIKSSSYILDENLYQKLHKLAIAKKMAACQMDIRNNEHVQKLSQAILKSKLKIGVLDLDNTYMSGYMGTSTAYEDMLKALLPHGSQKAILLAMAFGNEQEFYFGFTFENIKNWPKEFRISKLSEEVPGNTLAYLNGRLFSGTDLPKWIKVEIN